MSTRTPIKVFNSYVLSNVRNDFNVRRDALSFGRRTCQ